MKPCEEIKQSKIRIKNDCFDQEACGFSTELKLLAYGCTKLRTLIMILGGNIIDLSTYLFNM